jgi:hypothetical protein
MVGRRPSKRVRQALDEVEAATDPLVGLAAARRARDAAEALERVLVAEVRRRGGTWSQIGRAYGTTKQAAQQRFHTTTTGNTAAADNAGASPDRA